MPSLNRLERIVSRDLSVVVQHEHDVNAVTALYLIEDFPAALRVETDRIKNGIMQAVADMTHQDHLRKYIRKCQYRLITLNAKLVRYADPGKLVGGSGDQLSPVEILCQVAYRCLIELIAFLEQHFGRYIYWDAWVHNNFLRIVRKQVQSGLNRTTEVLDTCAPCKSLRQVIVRVFECFLDENIIQQVTYARIRYICELQQRINMCESESDLHALLLAMNFNTRRYIQYWSNNIERKLMEKPTYFEKLALLADEARYIRQHNFVRKAAYNSRALPLPEMMTRWIREEVDLLERLYNIGVAQTPESPGEEGKIELGVSVAVLAAAIRALIGSKAIADDNVTGLARLLSNCFTTIRSGGAFQPGTFRQSYYTIPDSAKKSVIDMFTKAIAWLRQN